MTKAREIAELGQRLTVDAIGEIDLNSRKVNIESPTAGSFASLTLTNGDDDSYSFTHGGDGVFYLRHTPYAQSNKTNLVLTSTGSLFLYNSSGDSKFKWDASSEMLGIGTDSPSNKLSLGLTSGAITRLLGEYGNNESPTFEVGVGQSTSFRGGMRIAVTDTGAGIVGDSVVSFHTTKDGGGTVERLTIDEDGNVGIGTISPSHLGHIYFGGAVTNGLKIEGANNGTIPALILKQAYNAKEYQIRNNAGNLTFHDETALAERMRIDSSGNVLVGTTSVQGAGGVTLSNAGYVYSSRPSSVAIYGDRTGSDGTIQEFRRDGTTVGSIGTTGGAFTLGNADTGLLFNASSDNIYPWNMSTGAIRDAAIDLGKSNTRFKDLYLSGTVSTNAVDLDAISGTISDTAVDVFVYDTRKDSDGGAWRKRTQHTSWYNETLNTSTRGSRKEFPAVAVIVAETAQVTIYDGDDPDLPMWMVFQGGTYRYVRETSITSVQMLNGVLFVGGNVQGPSWVNMIADASIFSLMQAGANYRHTDPVSGRNENSSSNRISVSDSNYYLVSNITNDVAMTVLPNAPIDAATGLPVPTIALATDGGVSVIKDDGTVVDITQNHGGTTAVDHLTIDPVTNAIYFTTDYAASGQAYKINAVPIPSADRAENSSVYNGFQDHFFQIQAAGNSTIPHLINAGSLTESNDINVLQSTGEGKFAVGEGLGLDQIIEDRSGLDNSMIAYTASDYATGWMNGDIKLATLSDTDDTDVTGSEVVTNGTFDTDTSGWTGGNGATLSVVSGKLRVTNDGSTSYPFAQQLITTEVGKTYTMSARGLTSPSYNWYIEVVGLGGSGQQTTEYQSHTFTAAGTSTYIRVIHRGAANGDYKDFDNVSVRLAEEDRSVNGNGLQVFGTITKNPVATGADLVAYSGFSGSNYLEQPYNSDLDFGTGDFCVMGWVKLSSLSGGEVLVSWGNSDTGGAYARWAAYVEDVSGDMAFFQRDGSTQTGTSDGPDVPLNTWNHLVWIRSASGVHFYLNGANHIFQSATAKNIDNSDNSLLVGVDYGYLTPSVHSQIALLRISATAPSPEQIKKIYEDEKVLFQENAQATLYGSSDAVTALAYDDSTELLHVGTSAGRSVFQGLRRVDNTTTAVGAAISASNGLVADE